MRIESTRVDMYIVFNKSEVNFYRRLNSSIGPLDRGYDCIVSFRAQNQQRKIQIYNMIRSYAKITKNRYKMRGSK